MDNRSEVDVLTKGLVQQRSVVTKLDRKDLEDRFLTLYEENLLLKKHARNQEDKIKRMATKLLRLVKDRKKMDLQTGSGGGKRDVEMEEHIENLQSKIRQLTQQNNQLKDKLMVAKQQLDSASNRATLYSHLPARVNTGRAKAPLQPRLLKGMRVAGKHHKPVRRSPSPVLSKYGETDAVRLENRNLEDLNAGLQEQMQKYEEEIASLREELKERQFTYDVELQNLKAGRTNESKYDSHENIELVRLQRELREKGSKLVQLEAQYANLEESFRAAKTSHEALLSELSQVNQKLKEEEAKCFRLENRQKSDAGIGTKIKELEAQIFDLKRENKILSEANDRLVNSAFDVERERQHIARENELKLQIAQLEATLKADLSEKNAVVDKLVGERDELEAAKAELRQLRVQHYTLKEQHDELKEKLGFFTKDSAVEWGELEEALVLVKQKKQSEPQELDFLEKIREEKATDLNKVITELQADHAETVNELEKTRNMLLIQHKINRDYQQEVINTSKKMEDQKHEYELKLQEYAQLLDTRAARIKKLERQLHDIAYGTRPVNVQDIEPVGEVEDIDETLELHRGENLLEIHITNAAFTPEGLKAMGDGEPSTFLTWEFYDFEMQSTPVLKHNRPEYDFTSRYVVKVDDFFLAYLQKESVKFELHQAYGTDYVTVAVGKTQFAKLMDNSQSRIHGSIVLLGTGEGAEGLNFGTVTYWARLRVPMDQALTLYKERVKALGYVSSNAAQDTKAITQPAGVDVAIPTDNINELHICIQRCRNLIPRREGVQPSTYVVYKFYDFADHDTLIIPSSNNPEFNDHMTYPVPVDWDLDRYLKSQALKLYVFDDTDPEQTCYLGIANIPLISLSHDKAIKGTFELKRMDGQVTGVVEVLLAWKFTYIPPRASTHTAQQIRSSSPEKPMSLHPAMPAMPASGATVADSDILHAKITVAMSAEIPEGQPASVTAAAKTHSTEAPATTTAAVIQRSKSPTSTAAEKVRGRDSPFSVSETVRLRELQLAADTKALDIHPTEPTAAPVPEMQPDMIAATEPAAHSLLEPVSTIADSLLPLHASTPERKPPPAPKPRERDKPSPATRRKLLARINVDMYESSGASLTADAVPGGSAESATETVPVNGKRSLKGTSDNLADTIPEELPSDDGSSGYSEESDTEKRIRDVEAEFGKPSPSPRKQRFQGSDQIAIAISHLTLSPDAAVCHDTSVQRLFVAFQFLGFPPEELETPFSLPKPEPGKSISFNFRKVFYVDRGTNFEKRKLLANMLLPGPPEDSKLTFSIVSEPPDDNHSADCEDIGYASIDVRQMLQRNSDFIDKDISIADAENESTHIGTLTVSVEGIAVLRAVNSEFTEPLR